MEHVRDSVRIVLFVEESAPRKIFSDALKEARISYSLEIMNFSQIRNELSGLENNFDIIFLSCNLPCADAIKSLKLIRSKKAFDKIPVVIFSNSMYLDEIRKAYRSGANLYISKRLLREEKIKTMQSIFENNWRRILLHAKEENFVLTNIRDNKNDLTRHAS